MILLSAAFLMQHTILCNSNPKATNIYLRENTFLHSYIAQLNRMLLPKHLLLPYNPLISNKTQ